MTNSPVLPTVLPAAPPLVLVVAAAANGVIGRDGAMPWHLPSDLRRFRQITMGKPVIMGRKTFDSIGRPLPGRHNIVLSREAGWSAEGVSVVPGFADAVALAAEAGPEEIMVIGGAQIFALARPIAERIELTRIHLSPDGDTRFADPEPAQWRETSRESYAASGELPAYDFLCYARY